MTPTNDQIDRAAALIKAIAAEDRTIRNLGRLIKAAEIDATNQTIARAEAVNFVGTPNNLANAIPRYRRTDAATKQHIVFAYERLLAEMQESFGPGTKPRKIDHNALVPEARVYLVGDFVKGLDVAGVLPRLCFERSNPAAGVLTYIVAGGFADPNPWKIALPQISSYLGANYQVTGSTATTITLTRRNPLPSVIPFDSALLKRDHAFYGFDVATHAPVYVPIGAMTHYLTVGQSGSGKSVFLNQVLLSLLFSIDLIDALTLIDLKGGVELARYAGVHNKIRVITDYDDLPDTAAALVATMHERLAKLRASGQRAVTSNFHFVVIDEYAAIQFRSFADKDAKQRHQKLLADLNLLAAQARAPGIKLWAQLQKPTQDAMDSSFRTNLQSIVAFKIANTNASVIFDGLKDMPTKPSDLAKGQFFLSLDGQPDRIIQACFVPDDIDLTRIVVLGRNRTARGNP